MKLRNRDRLLAGTLLLSCLLTVPPVSAQGTISAPVPSLGSQPHQAELKLEIVPEANPRFNYGTTIHLMIQVENVAGSDRAVCWSSLPDWRFVQLEVFSLDGRQIHLSPAGREVAPYYLFSVERDIVIFPATGSQLITRDLNTEWLPHSGACTRYLVSARYACRAGLETEWARNPSLCVGEYRSSRIQVQVDDRPFWKRILGLGTCPPYAVERGQPPER